MSEIFVQLPNGGNAFITNPKPDHECDDNGDGYMEFYNHEPMTQKQFDALPEIEQRKLNPSMGSVSCSICGLPYIISHNPNYL